MVLSLAAQSLSGEAYRAANRCSAASLVAGWFTSCPGCQVVSALSHPLLSPCCFFFFSRDVGYWGRHLSGPLEAAVAGKRDPLLPRVHDGVGAAGSDHAGHAPRARPRPARTHAPAPHLRHGEFPHSLFFFHVFESSCSDGELRVIVGAERAPLRQRHLLDAFQMLPSWGEGGSLVAFAHA